MDKISGDEEIEDWLIATKIRGAWAMMVVGREEWQSSRKLQAIDVRDPIGTETQWWQYQQEV